MAHGAEHAPHPRRKGKLVSIQLVHTVQHKRFGSRVARNTASRIPPCCQGRILEFGKTRWATLALIPSAQNRVTYRGTRYSTRLSKSTQNVRTAIIACGKSKSTHFPLLAYRVEWAFSGRLAVRARENGGRAEKNAGNPANAGFSPGQGRFIRICIQDDTNPHMGGVLKPFCPTTKEHKNTRKHILSYYYLAESTQAATISSTTETELFNREKRERHERISFRAFRVFRGFFLLAAASLRQVFRVFRGSIKRADLLCVFDCNLVSNVFSPGSTEAESVDDAILAEDRKQFLCVFHLRRSAFICG